MACGNVFNLVKRVKQNRTDVGTKKRSNISLICSPGVFCCEKFTAGNALLIYGKFTLLNVVITKYTGPVSRISSWAFLIRVTGISRKCVEFPPAPVST